MNDSSTRHSVLAQIGLLLQEAADIQQAQRHLYEAGALLEQNDPNESAERLLLGILNLPYSTLAATKLKTVARLLLARKKLRRGDRKGYLRQIEEMLAEQPLNRKIWALVQMEKRKQARDERKETEDQIYRQRIADLRLQADVWFWGSILTAVVLVSLSIYVVVTTVSRSDPLASLVSLVSFLPPLATKLVYDQSTSAHERADKKLEEWKAEHDRDLEEERADYEIIRKLALDEEAVGETQNASVSTHPPQPEGKDSQ